MTTKIYVQTTPVQQTGGTGRHLGIWIVENGQTTIIDAKASGALGPVKLDLLLPFGEILLEKTTNSAVPTQGAIEALELNQIAFASQTDAEAAADAILDYYNSMGSTFSDEGREFIRTGLDYNPLGANSNSITATILNLIGLDFRDLNLYENGDPTKT